MYTTQPSVIYTEVDQQNDTETETNWFLWILEFMYNVKLYQNYSFILTIPWLFNQTELGSRTLYVKDHFDIISLFSTTNNQIMLQVYDWKHLYWKTCWLHLTVIMPSIDGFELIQTNNW